MTLGSWKQSLAAGAEKACSVGSDFQEGQRDAMGLLLFGSK